MTPVTAAAASGGLFSLGFGWLQKQLRFSLIAARSNILYGQFCHYAL